jgi:hypothetical protein
MQGRKIGADVEASDARQGFGYLGITFSKAWKSKPWRESVGGNPASHPSVKVPALRELKDVTWI